MKENIFITGASGCIGHYVLDRLFNDPNYQLFLLIRDPKRLKFDPTKFNNLTLVMGDLENIGDQKAILSKIDKIIHIATAWGDSDLSTQVNKDKTFEMLDLCDPKRLRKIIYFSTASILGKDNKPLIEAETFGTGYVRSKYRTYMALKNSKYEPILYTVFPTLVFGGDETHPYSHISEGLIPNIHWAKWLRYIYMDARFHFLHAHDIAGVVCHILANNPATKDLALGNPVMKGKEVISEICKSFDIPVPFQLKLNATFIFFLIWALRIKIAPWDRFCFKNPFFEYTVVNPSTFGLKTKFPTLKSVIEDLKSQPKWKLN